MKRFLWLALASVLLVATLAPSRAAAQTVLPEQQCVSSFLAACATLHFIDFSETWAGGSKGVLRLIVANTSNGLGEANAYIHRLVFNLTGALPDVQALARVDYGVYLGGVFNANGDSENWKVKKTQKTSKGMPDGFQLDLDVHDHAKEEDGGNDLLQTNPGEAIMVEIQFEGLLDGVGLDCQDAGNPCQAWSAGMKGWGDDGKGKGYTSTPEPGSLILLATGLLGMVGISTARRRRRDELSD